MQRLGLAELERLISPPMRRPKERLAAMRRQCSLAAVIFVIPSFIMSLCKPTCAFPSRIIPGTRGSGTRRVAIAHDCPPSNRLRVRASRRVLVVRGQGSCLSQMQTGVCPEGTSDNSPAFQRWVEASGGDKSRRDGRNPVPKPGSLSSLRDSIFIEPRNPALKRRAIFTMSLRDRGRSDALDFATPS